MKRIYQTPITELHDAAISGTLMTASTDLHTTQSVIGGPGEVKEGGLSGVVGVNNGDFDDPSYTNGQGGSTTPGNRSNDWGLWDDNGSSYNLW